MAQRHLQELLSEEQEPFALESFIDERRCQLRRRPSQDPPASSQQQRYHLQIRRHASSTLESRALSPSALVKSPSSSFIPLREPFDCRRSPLLHLPHEKSPSRLTAALLLEAALRIQKQQEQQEQSHQKRRRRKKESVNPSRRFGLGFLASLLKRLVVRRRRRGIAGEEEEAHPFSSPAKESLKWDARHDGKVGQENLQTARNQNREADSGVPNPHCGSLTNGEQRKEGDGQHLRSAAVYCRCGAPESPLNAGTRTPPVSDGSSVPAGKASNSSPSRQLPGPSQPGGPSPELRTPASSPGRRRTEGQLFGGTGDDERAGSSYYEGKKEQSSPVSVLDAPFDEEVHQHQDHSNHTELEAQEAEGEEEGDEVDVDGGLLVVDSFQHSLAIVQRTKKELLSRIRRFEKLAELDPIELERRLAEEDEEDEDDDCEDPEATGCLDIVEMEMQGECELVRVAMGLCDGAGKIPADMRRLVLDLAEEESKFGGSVVAEAVGVEKTAEGVRRRLEGWKCVESNTIDMMVEMDLRQEGGGWGRFSEQVREAAAEVEAAVFALLVVELTEEFVGCDN